MASWNLYEDNKDRTEIQLQKFDADFMNVWYDYWNFIEEWII